MRKVSCCVTFRIMLATAISVMAFAVSAAPTRAEKIRAKLDSKDRDYVFVVMHRGDWRNAPENSVDAILGSIKKGADVVELDVAITKDGEYVLVHDDHIGINILGGDLISCRQHLVQHNFGIQLILGTAQGNKSNLNCHFFLLRRKFLFPP